MSEATNGNVNGAAAVLTRKDFTSDQEVRWCPSLENPAELFY